MKNIIFLFPLLISILQLSCSQGTVPQKKEVNTYVYDFRKYTDKGFLFTTEMYLGDYESVGLITVEIKPELRRKEKYGSPGQFYSTTSSWWSHIPISTEEVLDSLYSKSVKMGADALVNLDVEYEWEAISGNVYAPVSRASGFAIKRKGAFK